MKLYSLHKEGVINKPPTFPEHILGELLNKDEEDNQDHHSKRIDKSEENLEKRAKKKGKKKVSFHTQLEESFDVPEEDMPKKPKEKSKKKKKPTKTHVKPTLEETNPMKEFGVN